MLIRLRDDAKNLVVFFTRGVYIQVVTSGSNTMSLCMGP